MRMMMTEKKINDNQLKHDNSELDLVDIKFNYDKQRHEMRMEELKHIRESESIRHNHELMRGRIKTAEIRKSMDRKKYGR